LALSRHGIDQYLFTFAATPTETFADVTLASRIPAELTKVYGERDYLHDDPGFRHAQTTARPFRWFKDVAYDPETEPRAAEVVRFCADFGLVDGIVVPFVSPTRRAGQVWFGGSELDVPDHDLPALHLMALYAFDRVLELHGDATQPQDILTVREREVLTLVALGKITSEIGDKLRISDRMVNEHINNCRRKLGATTRAQAVMLAMRNRIIQP
jgi:LuxR family transcriptional regulator, quorum-sensing system regulator BjaR1